MDLLKVFLTAESVSTSEVPVWPKMSWNKIKFKLCLTYNIL